MSTDTLTPVTGIVIDKETNEPIKSAIVWLFAFLGASEGTTMTHKDGSFSITPFLPSPFYSLKILAPGYRTFRIQQIDPSIDSLNLGTLKIEKAPS